MAKIRRNEPCPCGSGKKFKHCHMGREEELVLSKIKYLPDDAPEKIASLPEVNYGRCREIISALDLEKLTGAKIGIKFIDLEAYLKLGFSSRQAPQDLAKISAGQMINPLKTAKADQDYIYLAISPAVSGSTLIHQLAHALDFLAGSKNNPALAGPLSMELDLPLELLEHPKEFGDWLEFLRNEFGVTLDAEDTIVSYLHQKGYLIPGEVVSSKDHDNLEAMVKRGLNFLQENRAEIDKLIKGREGYIENKG